MTTGPPTPQTRPPLLTIGFVSGSALAYEILLLRLFSIIQFHHFAFMIISLALLGYGASGTFISLTRQRLLARFPVAFLANILLFGATLIICYLVAQQVRFNPEEILWTPAAFIKLLQVYLLLALPFFFAANAIALALAAFPDQIHRLYSFDLVGAGLGSLGIVLLLFLVFPASGLVWLSSLVFLVAALAWLEMRINPRLGVLCLLVIAALPPALPADWFSLEISPYKGLSQQIRISGARIVAERSSPLGLLTVVENKQVPIRYVPGLSLAATTFPRDQLGVFTDNDAMTVITGKPAAPGDLDYLDQTTGALPYHIRQPDDVLVLGAGGGADILLARYHQADRIDAVELNPQMASLVADTFGAYSGDLFNAEGVTIHIAEARGFLATAGKDYDLIQFSAAAAGLSSLSANYLLTVESIRECIRRLRPDGLLAISCWLKLPPRNSLKILATAATALQKEGISDPGEHLILIRSSQTCTLLLKKSRISSDEIKTMRAFCRARFFDPAYYPGMTAEEANQYNVLKTPDFHNGAKAILSPARQDFLERYKFQLRPATDNRPYFFNFFKWKLLPEILALRDRGGMAFVETGSLVLAAALLQAVIISLLLILLPLFLLRHKTDPSDRYRTWRVPIYFSSIGLAFLFIEMAFIQKFILFLRHPLYATAAILAAFLIFAGLGSGFSGRRPGTAGGGNDIIRPVAGIVGLGLIYLLGLGPLFQLLSGLPMPLKFPLAVLLVGPLAFCMGMPFPAGLTKVGAGRSWLLPWAWGINGCASVVGAVLATMLAINFGLNTVVILALLLYILAALTFPADQGES